MAFFRRYLIFVALLCVALVIAIAHLAIGDFGMGHYEEAISSAKESVPAVREFTDLFPESIHLITYYNGRMGKPTWTSTVGLHGRYVLHMQFQVKFNRAGTRIESYTSPQFYLEEVESLSIDKMSESITPGEIDMSFGTVDWDKIVKAKGDLSALGISVKKAQPVPGFEEFWRRGGGKRMPNN